MRWWWREIRKELLAVYGLQHGSALSKWLALTTSAQACVCINISWQTKLWRGNGKRGVICGHMQHFVPVWFSWIRFMCVAHMCSKPFNGLCKLPAKIYYFVHLTCVSLRSHPVLKHTLVIWLGKETWFTSKEEALFFFLHHSNIPSATRSFS